MVLVLLENRIWNDSFWRVVGKMLRAHVEVWCDDVDYLGIGSGAVRTGRNNRMLTNLIKDILYYMY
jgi:hypothetical protein